MGPVVTVGLDIAKSALERHRVDAQSTVVGRRQVRRSQLLQVFAKLPGSLIGVEACASSHHWVRELIGLGQGVRRMPAQYVKPYVKRSKDDAAAAIASSSELQGIRSATRKLYRAT